MVADVPMTPTSPVLVTATARRTAGRITSTTGTSYRSRASARHAADAVLQAMTRILTPLSTSRSATARACRRTCAIGNGPYGPFAVSPTYRTCSAGSWSMIARATVRPPTPESKMPIGAVTSASLTVPTLPRRVTLPEPAEVAPPRAGTRLPAGLASSQSVSGGGDRPPAIPALHIRPPDQECGQQTTQRAEQVRLPGDGDHTGDVLRGDPDDAGPEQTAVQHQQHQSEQDVLPGPGPDAADDEEGQPAEDHAGGADGDAGSRRDQPHTQPGDQPDEGGDGEELAQPADRDEHTHDHQRHQVRPQVAPGAMDQRCGEHPPEPGPAARLDAELIEAVGHRPVDDLHDDHDRSQRADHDD